MESMPFFEDKVTKAFRFFDLNKNGYFSRKEVFQIADTISTVSNSNEAEKRNTQRQWQNWCNVIFPEGLVLLESYVDRNKAALASPDKSAKYQDETRATFSNMFERLDANKDGFISPEELRLYYKAFGYDEDYDIDQIFRTLDTNNDGLISHDEFVTAAATYWSNEPGYEFFFDPPKK